MTHAILLFPGSQTALARDLLIALAKHNIEAETFVSFDYGTDGFGEPIFPAVDRADVVVSYVEPGAGFVELGYAIGAGKKVVLVSDTPSQIPDSLAEFPVFDPRVIGGDRAVGLLAEIIASMAPKRSPFVEEFTTARNRLLGASKSKLMGEISPTEFNQLLDAYFRESGIESEVLDVPNALGADLVLSLEGGAQVAVLDTNQRSQARLGIAEVQRFVGACMLARVSRAVAITTGGFTTSAREFAAAAALPTRLLTIHEFLSVTAKHVSDLFTAS